MAGGKMYLAAKRYAPNRSYQKSRKKPKQSLVSAVRSIVDAELKVRDLSIAPVTVLTTGSLTNITEGILQGDGSTERSGNWIKPVSLYGTMVIAGNAGNNALLTEYRFYVLCWKEDESVNDATPMKIMGDVTDPFQGYNIPNKGQFQILFSKTGIVSNDLDNSKNISISKFSIKGSRLEKVLYSGDDAKKNQLFIGCFSSEAVDAPIFRFTTRLRYTDS